MKRQNRPASNGASGVSAGNVPNREGISKDAHLAGPLLGSSAAALIVLFSLLGSACQSEYGTILDPLGPVPGVKAASILPKRFKLGCAQSRGREGRTRGCYPNRVSLRRIADVLSPPGLLR